MKGLTLTTKEQTRLGIMNEVLERRLIVAEAAELMGVSQRHTWRLLADYRKEGGSALAHGNRGRSPANATSALVREQLVSLAGGRYQGVNHSHLTELLEEREGIALSRSTVRRLLALRGLSSPWRRRRLPRQVLVISAPRNDYTLSNPSLTQSMPASQCARAPKT